MRKVISYKLWVMALLLFLFSTHHYCFAQPISSTDLINNAKQYDGKEVVYTGEVIGDIMARGNFAWINVNDGKAAIGIWIEKGLTQSVNYTGSYKSKGDWIEISGVFHRACSEHGGDLDIHAQQIRKIISGGEIPEKLEQGKRNLVFILLGVLCLALILKRLKTK